MPSMSMPSNNRAMMLSERAHMSAKPELEIYADDVACAHGAALEALMNCSFCAVAALMRRPRAILISGFGGALGPY